MLEQADENTRTEVLDHHGIVAGACHDIQLIDEINKRIGSKDPRRVIQPGVAITAMIINGLGFTNRRLYLTPQFFQSKPVELLFGRKIDAKQLNEHALGKALDDIASYGATKLFAELAFAIGEKENLLEDWNQSRIDSTSFSLHGEYEGEKETETIEIKRGFSKDHRPDLKQVMLSLVVGTKANLPMWMEPQDGNTSDKSSFHQTVENVRSFQKELMRGEQRWIADSAFYTVEKIANYQDFTWITRVPESNKACKEILEQEEFTWSPLKDGYKYCELGSIHGGVKQRWIVISSDQAYKREVKTLDRKIEKEYELLKKFCWHLGNETFSCKKDAKLSLEKGLKKFKYHLTEVSYEEVKKHKSSGRPKKGEEKGIVGFRVSAQILRNELLIERERRKKGRFILATNDLDEEALTGEGIFNSYGSLQDVERGFAFLKDPWFMVDSFYLKSPRRIQALMMVMALCLFVYNLTQYRLRKALDKEDEKLLNQKGKESKTPTLKWIFQQMEGVGLICLFDPALDRWRGLVTNMDANRRKIIKLLGGAIQKIYGF